MKTIIIDNTRTAGNFFDNINNYEYLAQEYLFDNDDKIVIHQLQNHKEKYDYINNANINKFRNKIDEFYWDKYADKMFKFSLDEYQHIVDFKKNHKSCIRKENGMSKFGAIGGGFELVYKINYNEEELMLPRCKFEYIQCLDCLEKNKCDKVLENSIQEKNIIYPKFNKVEFYRFMEIYNEYKQPLTIKIIGTGLGWIFNIYVEDFIYDITNIDSW